MDTQEYLRTLPRIVFFTGKGGVGKTSVACATGLALADSGKKVLLVSTDPASNLDEVLGTPLTGVPVAIQAAENLYALNIDPIAAAKAHREQVLQPYRGVLPEASLASMEEQLSGACTVEIAAFNEFAKLLSDSGTTCGFDHIVFDTAPTGHTLRLLSLPAAWSSFIESNTTGTSCLGPLLGLQKQQALYLGSLQNLANESLTKVVIVSRPERPALREAERTHLELKQMGIRNHVFVLNGVFTAEGTPDLVARALHERCAAAISQMPAQLANLPRLQIPLLGLSLLGIDNLRAMLRRPSGQSTLIAEQTDCRRGPSLAALIEQIEADGPGIVLMMGKGGVGKTTIASAVALELARRGCAVQLTTTDPAAHLDQTVGEQFPGLEVSKIDPQMETAKYTSEIRLEAGPLLDEQGRALLDEDLRSPCTEEIAVFRAFAKTVATGESHFVVFDTAPTGHTILLLDAAEAFHREVSRSKKQIPSEIRDLLPRLRDPRFCRVILITLPEATPMHEAEHLQADLKRAGIAPFAWVINQSLLEHSLTDPVLRARQMQEIPFLAAVRDQLSERLAVVGWKASEPTGVEQLLLMAQTIF